MGDRAVFHIMCFIETRYIYALDPGECKHQLFALESGTFEGLNGVDDVLNDLFTLADHECIDEWMHRLRIGGGMPAGNDDGMTFIAVCRTEGNAGQVEDIEGVGVEGLVREGKADQVETGQGSL